MKDKNGKIIRKGDCVIVPDPNTNDSWNHEFQGYVHRIREDGYVVVLDSEDISVTVESERLEVYNEDDDKKAVERYLAMRN